MARANWMHVGLAMGALLLAAPSRAQERAGDPVKGESYVRFRQGTTANDGALQIAVTTFSKPNSEVEVVLYGVVHIAEKGYYRRVQSDLDAMDVVLFEGVKPGKQAPTAADRSLGELQQAMGAALGLTFQKDGIDYKRPNLVHADVTFDELKEALGGKELNPMGGMVDPKTMESIAPLLKIGMQLLGAMGMSDPLKLRLGQQMANSDLSQAMSKEQVDAILYKRNDVAYAKLQEQLELRPQERIAIFYGAAHMPDLEERLLKDGFALAKKRWMNAWEAGQPPQDDGDDPTLVQSRLESGATRPAPEPRPAEEPEPAPTGKPRPRWF